MGAFDQYINQINQNQYSAPLLMDGPSAAGFAQQSQQAYQQALADRKAKIQEGIMQGAFNQEQLNQLMSQGDVTIDQIGSVSNYWKQYADKQKADFDAQLQQIEIDKKRGYDKDGRPIAPDWQGISNADGTLKDQYKLPAWQTVNANTDALGKLRESALRDPSQASPWAKMMLEKQGLEQQQALDNSSRGGMNALNQMQSQLAQSGGLSGGARERMVKSAFRDNLLNKQGINSQGALNKLNIGLQDEQQRLQGLNTIQGMENQQADIAFKNQQAGMQGQQWNMQNQLKEVEAKRLWDANRYNQDMQSWAANKSADAQAKAARSSGGGGKK